MGPKLTTKAVILDPNLKIAEKQVQKVVGQGRKKSTDSNLSVDSTSKSIASTTQIDGKPYGSTQSDSSSDQSTPRSTPRSTPSRRPTSSGPRPTSPSPRSRSSSSVDSQPPLIPVPIPNSDAVYDSIKQKISKIKQTSTESIQFVTPKNIDTKKRVALPNYYLFVVLDKDIINFFESIEKFTLGSTMGSPNNYIFSKKNDFNSIFSFQNSFIQDSAVSNIDDYTGIKSLTPIIKNTSIIEFYVYSKESQLINTYYTYGNLFIYEDGIASTCEIASAEKIPEEKRQTILPRVNSNEKMQFLPSNYATSSDKAKIVDELILKIKTDVFGTTTALSKQQILIHYLNAISPEDLKVVLPNNWVDVVKILYVNISCPDEATAELKVDNYIRLHKYVNYYYKYKSENNSNVMRKTNEYLLNDTTYFSPFAMHIFDFFEFLMFLKNKTTTNEVNCCIEIYNFYIANYHDGFSNLLTKKDLITQLQQKMQEKQKKIYTYLQIVKDTEYNNKRYEIQLNESRTTINPDTTNNEKSMKLIYKTKTASLKKPIINESIYKIGPFDKIYKPTFELNSDAVDEPSFQEIITKITSGAPMMISFHGPISSARTKVSRHVILNLCKKVEYPNLEISFQEFFKKHDGNPDDESSKINTITLTLEENEFKITSKIIPDPYHSTKMQKNSLQKIKQGDSFESLLTYYFDTNRLTKRVPTYLDNANSFDSPRSHVLCFIKMTRGDEKPLYIIFDDLAGNETKNDCTNETILNKFAIFKNKDKLFYENEFDSTGNNFDFYNGGTVKQEMDKSKTESKTLYNKLIKEACEHRSIEGDFINESLQQFRADLEYMVDVKNRDNKYYVPDIFVEQIDEESIKTCLQDFCFGKTGCFGLKNIKAVKEPTSIVLKSVYTFLKNNWEIVDSTNFYDNLEVCVFGVFNISAPRKEVRSHLNEPPNYININKLKSIIYGKDEFTFNNNPGVFTAFKDVLQKTTEYTKRLSALYGRFPENYVDKLIELCNNEFKPDVRGGNPITKLSLAQIETFKAVFDAIDDENAKTAIGTLEFMNKISKLNTVDSICEGVNDSTHYAPIKPN